MKVQGGAFLSSVPSQSSGSIPGCAGPANIMNIMKLLYNETTVGPTVLELSTLATAAAQILATPLLLSPLRMPSMQMLQS